MIDSYYFPYITSLACTGAGMAFLFVAWKSRIHLKDAYSLTGWVLLLYSAFALSALDGWVFGLVYLITTVPLAAFFIVVLNAESRSPAAAWPANVPLARPRLRTALGHVGRFSLIVPFALFTSILPSVGLGFLLPMSELNQMVFAVCAMPLIWGVAASAIAASERPLAPATMMLLLSAISLIPIYFR